MLPFVYFFVYLFAGGVPGLAIPCVPRYNLFGGERIIGGRIINITEAPYHVSLQTNGYHFCGGSIISSYHVLTAAHCLDIPPSDQKRLLIGSASENLRDIETRATVRHVMHPKYNPAKADYDVGVVKVAIPFVESAVRKIIHLVPSGQQPGDAENVIVTGWGDTYVETDDSCRLRLVEVNIVGDAPCKKAYPELSPRMICAGVPGGGKDSCVGDSGGPLIVKGTGRQVGIVSWGIGCALKDFPGVYANVADKEVHDFIDGELKQLVDFDSVNKGETLDAAALY